LTCYRRLTRASGLSRRGSLVDVEVAILGARLAQTAALRKCEGPRGTVQLPRGAKLAEQQRKLARESCVPGCDNGADVLGVQKIFGAVVADERLGVVRLPINAELVQLVVERALVLSLEPVGACAGSGRICSQLFDLRLKLRKLRCDRLLPRRNGAP